MTLKTLSFSEQVRLLTLHELRVARRTRRGVMAALIYLGVATLGGIAVVTSLHFIEQHAMSSRQQRGSSAFQTHGAIDVVAQPAFEQMLAFAADVPLEQLSPMLRDSVVLPLFFWGSLAFLPLLILLTSFDTLTIDVSSGGLRYSLLRVPRGAVVLGKFAAHTLIFWGLTALSAALWVVFGSTALSGFDIINASLGWFRTVMVLLPFGLCYLAIVLFASSLSNQPNTAAVVALVIMVALSLVGSAGSIPPEHALAVLRPLQWLSPGAYEPGLWTRGFALPLRSVLAYSLMAATFVGFTTLWIKRRSL